MFDVCFCTDEHITVAKVFYIRGTTSLRCTEALENLSGRGPRCLFSGNGRKDEPEGREDQQVGCRPSVSHSMNSMACHTRLPVTPYRTNRHLRAAERHHRHHQGYPSPPRGGAVGSAAAYVARSVFVGRMTRLAPRNPQTRSTESNQTAAKRSIRCASERYGKLCKIRGGLTSCSIPVNTLFRRRGEPESPTRLSLPGHAIGENAVRIS